MRWMYCYIFALMIMCVTCKASEQVRIVPVGEGWAQNKINSVIFRQHALTSHGDSQYIAYYDGSGRMVLAKRKLGSDKWQVRKTRYTGNVRDAHCSICIAVDGSGVLHVSWGHHGQPLNYARSVYPGSLLLTDKLPMTGQNEHSVTYPEFFNLDNGDLLCMYRSGGSGNGVTMLNRWSNSRREWTVVQHPLISGEGQRNAYTNQIAIDSSGAWHVSWCWRETADVATNHDICYARSEDGGLTWMKSSGEIYDLPITAKNADYVRRIPQNSQLINTTTTAVDSRGYPLIATYWSPEESDVPQYHLVRWDGSRWQVSRIGNRTLNFRLSGGGTRRIVVSRPKLAVDRKDRAYMLFKDDERGGMVSVAVCDNLDRPVWRILDLTQENIGFWEPNYDTQLWKRDEVMHIFLQKAGQGDGETLEAMDPQPVSVLEWRP